MPSPQAEPTPGPGAEPLNSASLQDRALLWLVLLVTALFAVVLWPFSGAILWAIFLAIVFSSLQERSVAACGGRRGWAAFATLAVIVVSVMLPMALLLVSVTQEAGALYQRVKAGDIQLAVAFQRAMDLLPAWAHGWLERTGIADLAALQHKVVEALGQSAQALTARVFSLTHTTLEFVVSFFVMLYLLYFLLRDGRALSRRAAHALPLKEEHTTRLLNQLANVVRATVKGNVVVALVQGALGGLAFWVLDLPGAVLWGSLMALMSLVPAIGHVLVWGPAALYLAATGNAVGAIGLTLWSVFVIGLVDNVLRPILVGKQTKMPDYLVLIATLGGIAAFGLNGFVIGPVIAAMFISAWEIFAEARHEEHAVAPAAPLAPQAKPDAPEGAPAADQETM